MFIPIPRKSNHINVHLTTTDTDIQALIDEILNEISLIKKISNRSRSREALKKVILNLIHAEQTKGCIRLSRSKNDYGHHRMYGKIWLKYDRLIPIVDGLIELGYVEHLKGYWDKEKKTGRQTKIWASDKLRSRFFMLPATRNPKSIERVEPEQVIQLKDSSKKLVPYTHTKPIVKTRKRLEQYNNFIQEQFITVNLTEEVKTDNEFWCNNLLNGLLNGSYTLDGLKLNQELNLTNTYGESYSIIHLNQDSSTNPINILIHCSHHSTSSSTITSSSSSLTTSSPTPNTTSTSSSTTITSTHTPTSSTNTHNPTFTSTLLSHIQVLIHLSSTKEKQRRVPTDGTIMISDDELMDCFLNWLLFLSNGIKRGWDDKQIRQAYRTRSSLEKLGISELVFRLKYESCHRIFNKSSFKNGGRFYGASHLDIPSHMRGFIHINGEPVVELDYDALHVVMLYHLRGIDINLTQDQYDMIVGSEERSIKKMALLTAINAPTEAKAIKGIRKTLVDDGITGDILTDKSLKSLIARAKLAHSDITDDIASGRGIELQNIDSRIADAILTNLMALNIPALPVHDSFVVPQKCESLLRQQMVDEYEKILGFKPGVSKKKKRYSPKKWKNWHLE